MNSVRMRSSRRSAVTFSSVTQAPPLARRPGAHDDAASARPSRSRATPLSPAGRRADELLEAVVDERLHQRAPVQGAGSPLERVVGGQVGVADAEGGVEADQAERGLVGDASELLGVDGGLGRVRHRQA